MSWHRDDDGLWELTCDACRDGWYGWDGDVRSPSRADLQARALKEGWAVGASGELCVVCSLVALCALLGHRWQSWTTLVGGKRVRFCDICGHGEYQRTAE